MITMRFAEANWHRRASARGERVERKRRRSGATHRQARGDHGGVMLAILAMARSAERWVAMPSAGQRPVIGALTFNYRERLRALGDGAQHRAEASNVTTLGTSANDEGAKHRVMKRDTVAGGGRRSIMGGSEAAKQRARCRDEGVWLCKLVGEVANPTAGLLNRAATAATLMRRSTGGQVMRNAQCLCSDGERGVYGS